MGIVLGLGQGDTMGIVLGLGQGDTMGIVLGQARAKGQAYGWVVDQAPVYSAHTLNEH